MKKNFLRLVPCLLIAQGVCAYATGDPDTSPVTTPALSLPLPDLLRDLGHSEFSARASASARLRELSTDDVRRLADLSSDEPNPEVVIRVQAEIDARYASDNSADVDTASDVLEAQAVNDRIMLADVAQHSLRQHWQKRIRLATEELARHGAIIRHGSFSRGPMFPGFPPPPTNTATIQVLMTESWTGGDAELAIFERLSALSGPVVANNGLSVFLIGGNPLTDEQESWLTSLVGQNRIAKRSRVALGIVANRAATRGVLIDRVSGGSSAAAAGLKAGDWIIAIDEKDEQKPAPNKQQDDPKPAEAAPPAPDKPPEDKTALRDFDDLVDRLMDYREGDIMTLRVVRGFEYFSRNRLFRRDAQESPPPTVEVIKVRMKGWADLTTEE